MELRQLQYFLVLSDTLHYGKAAEYLHIAQQPLSFQIKKLESELGYKLFERTTRSVALTPAGEVLKKKVFEGIRTIEQGVEQAGSVARGEAGKIRIAYNSMTLHNVMPQIVCKFRERFPQIEVILSEENSPELEQNIINDEADVGIVALYGIMLDELKYEIIYTDPASIALPKSHPLTKNKAIKLSELQKESFLVYSRKTRAKSHDDLISVCYLAGFTPNIIQEAETDMALLGLVATGLGVALVPGSFNDILSYLIEYRIIKEPAINLNVAMVWREGNNSLMIQQLLEISKSLNNPSI
ncbi:LysR family transcriptional regulator [Clostridium felsineum]|uniref:LysR family transcriptional regulator n=1 Tax=Clostridium felsineum TaxID=36839 RepID=UPI0009CC79B9|nr:LysR family transcriptional regulator [Clostridium felsineum]URZ18418.1 HTH-type transcriptional regulator GltC [Clostridium felsineum DSM 794]